MKLLLTAAAISLEFHHAVPTGFLHLGWDLIFHLRAARALFLRIAEDAEALKLRFADERAKLIDVRLGFTGNPTMKVVRMAMPGIPARMRLRRSRM